MRDAALRTAEALVRAAEGGYYRNGWYSYLSRADIERLALEGLNPTEAAVYRRRVRVALGG